MHKCNNVDYRREIELFVTWFDGNVLKLNVEKTILDYRRNKEVILPVTIKMSEMRDCSVL